MKLKINILTTLGIAVMALILTATSCRDDGPVPTIYLNESFKEFIYFKEGTWWVYQHTEDSTRDSMVVVRSEIKEEPRYTDNWETDIGWYSEEFYYDIYSFKSTKLYGYWGGTACSRDLDEETLRSRDRPCYYGHRRLGGAQSILFFYYPVLGYEVRTGGTTVTIAKHYDSLEISGRYYHDVYRIHETNNQIEGANETNFYVARGYGIIRKEINDKDRDRDPDNWHYWDLVEANIVQ